MVSLPDWMEEEMTDHLKQMIEKKAIRLEKNNFYKRKFALKVKLEKPWLRHLYWARQRCKYNSYYKDRKCLLNEDELKYLWFRDSAFKLLKPSLDRIDNNGDYKIENCRFMELKDNQLNKDFKLPWTKEKRMKQSIRMKLAYANKRAIESNNYPTP